MKPLRYIKEYNKNTNKTTYYELGDKTDRKLEQLRSILGKTAKLTQEALNLATSLQTSEGKPLADFVKNVKLDPVTFTDEQRAYLFKKQKSKFFVHSHELALQTLQYIGCVFALLDTIREA